MVERYLTIPLLSRSVKTFRSPTWYLDDGVYLTGLRDEDYGAIFSSAKREISALVNPKQKVVYVDLDSLDNFPIDSRRYCSLIRFVFSVFSEVGPVACEFSVAFEKRRKARLVSVEPSHGALEAARSRASKFSFRSGCSVEEVSTYFKVVKGVLMKNPSFLLTIERFNSSVSRTDFLDSVVDLTIALESLIPDTGEVRYRFASYFALISTGDLAGRDEKFKLFHKLYDVRSRVVHGGIDPAHMSPLARGLENQWDEVVKSTLDCLNYYVLFLHTHTQDEWRIHLRQLALGIVRPITTDPA